MVPGHPSHSALGAFHPTPIASSRTSAQPTALRRRRRRAGIRRRVRCRSRRQTKTTPERSTPPSERGTTTSTRTPTETSRDRGTPTPPPSRTYSPTNLPSVLPPGANLKGKQDSNFALYAMLGFVALGIISTIVIWNLSKYHKRSMHDKRLKTLELRGASANI